MINVYCDESCHLENDNSDVMVLGCISCPKELVKSLNAQIRQLKEKHNISKTAETKWTKVSLGKIEFYKELIDLFFNTPQLNFRAVIAQNKSLLDHAAHNQDHDGWYYKMYYLLLRNVVEVGDIYRVYVDIKDTKGSEKLSLLQDVLNRSLYNFYEETVERIQLIRSDEVELIQLNDLMIGAISYVNRGCNTSKAKLELVEHMMNHTGLSLKHKTAKDYNKFNIFVWTPNWNQRR